MGCPGSVTLGDSLTFCVLTKSVSSGMLVDADAVPTYRVYEAETATPILSGSMALLDSTNTTGFYSEAIAVTVANGFEASKSYNIYVTYTVYGNIGGETFGFKVWAEGPGDYAVTLTIRTTGGTPIPGVSVWLNTASDRAGAVAGPSTTNDAGLVTFYLHYTTYNVYCHLAGYTFSAATITPAAGSVAFIKDIGTAAVVGGTSGYEDSFLTRAIAKVRQNVDEPSINAKYTDANIIEQLEFSYIAVLAEKNRNAQTPAVARITITIASDITTYILPYTVGSVVAIYEGDGYGGKLFYDARSDYNALGKRIWVEGNTLKLQASGLMTLGTSLTVEYIPSGVARLHNGTCTLGSDGTTATLGATPHVGTLDTHTDGYIGSILRILNVTGTTVTGNVMQERTISAYNNVTRVATLSPALSPVATTSDGSILYEIAPAIHKGLDLIVALHAAYTIASIEGNLKRAKTILDLYRGAIRNVRLDAYYSNLQQATEVRGDNYDNRFY